MNWSNGSTGTKDLTAGEYLKYNIDPPAAMPSGEVTPEIGDYFYQGDGTGSPDRFLPAGMMTGTLAADCLGVVFWVDPQNAASGMVVSKDEVDLPWQIDTASMPAGYSDKLNYGKANTELVMNIPNAENLYPAFAWCAGKGPGWYFPSNTEMNLIWNAWARGTIDRPNPPLSLQQSAMHIAAFNEKLTKISGKEFIADKIYSSSTLGPLSGIQTVTFSVPVPSQAGGGFSETTACPVRAVRTY